VRENTLYPKKKIEKETLSQQVPSASFSLPSKPLRVLHSTALIGICSSPYTCSFFLSLDHLFRTSFVRHFFFFVAYLFVSFFFSGGFMNPTDHKDNSFK